MPTQKDVERIYLDEARRASSMFPSADPEASDPLDFLFARPEGALGVEVTELCAQEDRATGARLSHVAPQAERLYRNRPGATPVVVCPVLAPDAPERKVGDLASALADFVYKHRDANETFRWDTCDDLPAGYTQVGIFKPKPGEPNGKWIHYRAFATRPAPRELLADRIADKNRKLVDYRKRASEVWLLIVNDLFLGPGEVSVRDEDLAQWQFDFEFEKVLLFERQPGGSGKVFEVRRA